MEGMTVMETTFSWNMLSGGGRGGGVCGDSPAFVTATGRAIGWNKKHAPVSCAGAFDGNSDSTCDDNGVGGGVSAVPSQKSDKPFHATITTTTPGLYTPGPTGVDGETGGGTKGGCGGMGREGQDVRSGLTSAPVVTPHTMSTPLCHPGTPSAGSVSLAMGEGRKTDTGAASPETRAAKAAAQASLSVIRQSIIRRRGGMPNRAPLPPPAVGQDAAGVAAAGSEAGPPSDVRLCATPFVIRRPPSSSVSVPRPASYPRPASTPGAGAKGGPLNLNRASADGSGDRNIGHGKAPTEKESERAPDTPAAAGRGNPAAQLVTPATGDMTAGAAATSAAAGLKRPRTNSARGGLGGKAPKRGTEGGVVAGGPAAADSRGKGGRPLAGISRSDAGGLEESSDAASVNGRATTAVVAVAAAAAAPPSAPTKIVVTFSAAGSLGMGVAKDVTEEGSVILAGKAPTSAAAVVPNGWRLTEVDGKNARGLGGGWVGGGKGEEGGVREAGGVREWFGGLEDGQERSLGEPVAVGSSTGGLACPTGLWTIKSQCAHPWQYRCRIDKLAGELRRVLLFSSLTIDGRLRCGQ